MGRLTPAALLLAVLAVSAVPRCADLGRPSLTHDEYHDYQDSLAFCRSGAWTRPASDGFLNGQAPFVAACLAYRAFGQHELVARGISAAAGLAAVAGTALLGAQLLGWRWGLAAALLLGLSPFAVSSSRLAFSHGHAFHVPFVLLGFYAVLRRRGPEGSARWAGAAGVALGLAAGADLLAALWVPTALGFLVAGERGLRPRVHVAAWFGAAWLAGLALASPMYAFQPLEALGDVRARMAFWDRVDEYLWLGQPTEHVPASYYAVILMAKMNPLVLALAAVGVVVGLRRAGPGRVLLVTLWPLLYLSLRPWKSPFYLAAFVPVLVLLAAAGLRALVSRLSAPRARRSVAGLVAGVAAAISVALGASLHPDYLMLGIHYGDRLYGNFQGPAVAHGQWLGEALEFVRQDAGGRDPRVMVPQGQAPGQLAFYAQRHGLGQVFTSAERAALGLSRHQVDYLVVTQDCLRHGWDRGVNHRLLAFARDERHFRRVRAFGAGPLELVWVYRRVND